MLTPTEVDFLYRIINHEGDCYSAGLQSTLYPECDGCPLQVHKPRSGCVCTWAHRTAKYLLDQALEDILLKR